MRQEIQKRFAEVSVGHKMFAYVFSLPTTKLIYYQRSKYLSTTVSKKLRRESNLYLFSVELGFSAAIN